jgi:hypothetical protein
MEGAIFADTAGREMTGYVYLFQAKRLSRSVGRARLKSARPRSRLTAEAARTDRWILVACVIFFAGSAAMSDGPTTGESAESNLWMRNVGYSKPGWEKVGNFSDLPSCVNEKSARAKLLPLVYLTCSANEPNP